MGKSIGWALHWTFVIWTFLAGLNSVKADSQSHLKSLFGQATQTSTNLTRPGEFCSANCKHQQSKPTTCPGFLIERARGDRFGYTHSPLQTCISRINFPKDPFTDLQDYQDYLREQLGFEDYPRIASSCIPQSETSGGIRKTTREIPEVVRATLMTEYYASLTRLKAGQQAIIHSITLLESVLEAKQKRCSPDTEFTGCPVEMEPMDTPCVDPLVPETQEWCALKNRCNGSELHKLASEAISLEYNAFKALQRKRRDHTIKHLHEQIDEALETKKHFKSHLGDIDLEASDLNREVRDSLLEQREKLYDQLGKIQKATKCLSLRNNFGNELCEDFEKTLATTPQLDLSALRDTHKGLMTSSYDAAQSCLKDPRKIKEKQKKATRELALSATMAAVLWPLEGIAQGGSGLIAMGQFLVKATRQSKSARKTLSALKSNITNSDIARMTASTIGLGYSTKMVKQTIKECSHLLNQAQILGTTNGATQSSEFFCSEEHLNQVALKQDYQACLQYSAINTLLVAGPVVGTRVTRELRNHLKRKRVNRRSKDEEGAGEIAQRVEEQWGYSFLSMLRSNQSLRGLWRGIKPLKKKIDDLKKRAENDPALAAQIAAVEQRLNNLRAGNSTSVRQARRNSTTGASTLPEKRIAEAEDLVEEYIRRGIPLSTRAIQKIHKKVNTTVEAPSGVLRGKDDTVYASSGNNSQIGDFYIFGSTVKEMIDDFVRWYHVNRHLLSPVELASLSYQRMVSIHPFKDGNGRTSRIIMNWILESNGLPKSTLIGAEKRAAIFGLSTNKSTSPETVVKNVTRGIYRTIEEYQKAGLIDDTAGLIRQAQKLNR